MTNEEIEIGGLYWTRVRRGWIQVKVTGRTSLTSGGKRKRKAFCLENAATGKEITPRRAGALHLEPPEPVSSKRPALTWPTAPASQVLTDLARVRGELERKGRQPDIIVIDAPYNDAPPTPAQQEAIKAFYDLALAKRSPAIILPELPPAHPPNFRCTIEGYTPTVGPLPWPKPPEHPPDSCQHCGGSGIDAAGGTRAPTFCLCPAGLQAKERRF